jgi:hypothetical protein
VLGRLGAYDHVLPHGTYLLDCKVVPDVIAEYDLDGWTVGDLSSFDQLRQARGEALNR